MFAVNVAKPPGPGHIGLLLVAPVDDGIGFTLTVVVYTVAFTQPLPVPVIVNEYVLVMVGVAVGLVTVDEDKFGPDHVQPVVELFVLASRFTVPPWHIGPLLVGLVDDGTALTLTIVV